MMRRSPGTVIIQTDEGVQVVQSFCVILIAQAIQATQAIKATPAARALCQ